MAQYSPSPNGRVCCGQPENLNVIRLDSTGLVVRQCSICGARHWELNLPRG